MREMHRRSYSISDTIIEARQQAPVRQEASENESYVYSSDRGTEPAGEDDRIAIGRPGGMPARPVHIRCNPPHMGSIRIGRAT